MACFKKGNKYTFKPGNIPAKLHAKVTVTIQNTQDYPKKKHSLVVNIPYLDFEEKSHRALYSAKFLCPRTTVEDVPKSKEKPVKK